MMVNCACIVGLLGLLCAFPSTVFADLSCYKCVNIGVDSSNPLIKSLLSGKSDPGCYPLQANSEPTTTCSDPADMCGLVKGSAEFNIPLVGKVTLSLESRDCMPSSSTGCQGSAQVKEWINEILAFLPGTTVSVDGNVCFCNEDNCDAGCSGLFIGDYCATYVLLGGAGGGLLLLIVTCCCCCCCCCRRSRPTHGVVVQTLPAMPQVTILTVPPHPIMNQGATAALLSPDGTAAFSNVMYDIHNPQTKRNNVF